TLSRGCQERGYQFIVIGDESSPADFRLDGCRFYSLAEQAELPFKIARLTPTRHYARKNLGYLIALNNGASIILETDDDNIPYQEFWNSTERVQAVPVIEQSGWVNIYSYFSEINIWPRGLPLNRIHDRTPPFESFAVREA